MSANHETDSTIEDNKSWEVEFSSNIEEFEDYTKALDLFNLKSNQGDDAILYEIKKSKLDGSVLKRIPLLNTKQSKKRKEELEKKTQIHQQKKQETQIQNKNKFSDIKYRIIILIIIVVAFLILLYVLSQLVTSSNTFDSHFILNFIITYNMEFLYFPNLSVLINQI